MKKIVLMMTLAVLALGTNAQVTRELRVHDNGMTIFRSARLDSVKLVNGEALFGGANGNWHYAIAAIDSITFGPVSAPDTTAVDTTGCIRIDWGGDGEVTVTNPYSAVTIDATTAHVTVNAATGQSDIVYCLTGATADGSLRITSDKKVLVLLNGVSLTSSNGPALQMLSDKKMTVHLAQGSANSLSDGTGSSGKGALQAKDKLTIQGGGTLQVHGMKKHGIQSAGLCTMLGGTVQVVEAASDAMNVDGMVMENGTLVLTATGDGLDGDQGMIEINGGEISVSLSGDDVKAIGCDSTLTINGGSISVWLSGNDSKGLRTKHNLMVTGGEMTLTGSGDQSKLVRVSGDMSVYGGHMEITASGSMVGTESGNGTDYSYCTGIKVDGDMSVYGGNIAVGCPQTNVGGKGIAVDGNVLIADGVLDLEALGACGTYTNVDGELDSYVSTCLKTDGTLTIGGGSISCNAYGRGINAEMDILITGGTLDLSTSGNGFAYGNSGTAAQDGFAPVCMKTDHNMTILGGDIRCQSTGTGGRGISVDSTLTIGEMGADDDLLSLYCSTSGNPVVGGSTGGWGGNHGSTNDNFKGLPKGIKVDGDIVMNSGKVGSYCSQTSGDPNGEAIEAKGSFTMNGGEVEANSFDDAINSGTRMDINGGRIWAYSRGNDAIDNNGTQTYFNGGLVIAISDREMGVDASTDAGGHFYINGATVISKGQMGAWDRPTTSGIEQKYIQMSVSIGQPFCVKNSNGDEILVFQAPTVSGSGFFNFGTGTKPPPGGGGQGGGGVTFTSPDVTAGTYQVFSNTQISGGSQWHGLYSGATCTTTGNGTSVSAQ